MEYGVIVRRAWALAWQNKSLWILGLFAGGGGMAGFNWNSDKFSPDKLHISTATFAVFGLGLLFLALVFILLSILANAAIIDAVNRLARGGVYRLRDSFSVGVDFFWRFLGLCLLGLGTGIILVAILAVPGILCFMSSTLVGVMSLLVLVPLFLAGAFVINGIFQLAARALVVRNSRIGDAVEEGYLLFRNRLGSNLAIFLIYLVLAIGVSVISLVILGIIGGPFVAMALLSTAGLVAALLIGLPLVILVMWVMNGLTGSFFSAIYTLFYFELVEPSAAPFAPPQPTGLPT
jgi:hypothetical protein